MLLLLDNYDSFTYNIDQLFSDIGAQVEVVRSDKISIDEIRANGYRGVIISPGPGIPQDAGISEEVIRQLGGEIPILGICLGHQAIGEVFGGRVVRAGEIVHGKASPSATAAQGSIKVFLNIRKSPATTLSLSSVKACPMCWR